jgi:hypothetical protein
MFTLFSTPKPFRGHSNVIQRNALCSWTALHPDIEIILFGDDEGTAEICHELGLRNESHVLRSEYGTKRLDWIFGQAQKIARHDFVCYINCDIILTQEFRRAAETLLAWRPCFLMVGRRWDTNIAEPIDFSRSDWQELAIARARSQGVQRSYNCVDFFLYPRGLYPEIPPLVIGRNWWDQWLVWKARDSGVAIVNVSDVVTIIHQNHDYRYHPQGITGVWQDEEAQRNIQLAGGHKHLRTIEDADYRLTKEGVRRALFYQFAPTKRRIRKIVSRARSFGRVKVWHPVLRSTRPLRHALGLRQESLPAALTRRRPKRSVLDDGH